ncbi:hypothetical protein glysoja_021473 [Glycine soja]|nr:hypothetical protein glysoja_021473 [Glycine soja]
MKPIDDKQETVTIRAVSHDEEGRKRVEKTELNTHNIHTIKYVEKKLINKGVQRGKFTWEGPASVEDNELMTEPAAMDEGDPNYLDWEERGEETSELVVGEVEVAKVAEEHDGVARVEVDPRLRVIMSDLC